MANSTESLIIELNGQVIAHRDAYYNGNPTISDGEYDKIELELKTLVATHPEFAHHATAFKKVGSTIANGGRISLPRPARSIENYFDRSSYVAATSTYGDAILEEFKRDGISAILIYEDCVLVQALTRGDGEAGEDMTAQVKACRAIPQKLKPFSPITDMVRRIVVCGELVMRNSELARINTLGGRQYSNTRNLVAGTMKQKDLSIVASREILLMPWDLYSPDQDEVLPDSAHQRMRMAEAMGFPAYEGVLITGTFFNQKVVETLDVLLTKLKDNDITCDGVVAKADSHKVRARLGIEKDYTNYQHCFKPQNLKAVTKLVGVEYGLGRTGKVTPVALLAPVNLGGAMVGRASLSNETWMKELPGPALSIGSEVEIVRSGDVIPYVLRVVSVGTTPIVFPTKCPSCGTQLQTDPDSDKVIHYCENSECYGKAAELFTHVGARETLEIDNLGDVAAAELVSFGVTNIATLFEFGNRFATTSPEQFKAAGFRSGANTVKLVKSLPAAKKATWERWFASLSIPMIGHTLGETLAKELNLTSDNMENLCAVLLNVRAGDIAGLGPAKLAAIHSWASNPHNYRLCQRLHAAGVRPTPITAPVKIVGKLTGKVICITGELVGVGSRPQVEAQLVALGAEVVDDVKKTCNLLIVGEKPGSKVAKAQKKGVEMVGIDWVKEVLA